MKRKIINPWKWQENWGYVHANEFSNFERILEISGQTAADSEGVVLHIGDMRGQVSQALDNLETVLKEAGMDFSDIIRIKYFTTDVDAFLAASDILGKRLGEAGCQPAATLLGVVRLATPDVLVEFEATAVV